MRTGLDKRRGPFCPGHFTFSGRVRAASILFGAKECPKSLIPSAGHDAPPIQAGDLRAADHGLHRLADGRVVGTLLTNETMIMSPNAPVLGWTERWIMCAGFSCSYRY